MNPNLITYLQPKSPISEAYRMIRTNLHYSSYDKELKTILVTSAGPGEGKSVTMGNIAIAIAQTGKKVLLIDGDLRKPKVHRYFDLANVQGVTNVIVGEAHAEDVIQQPKDMENLYVLTSGPVPPNPSELLGSQKMKDFITSLKEQFDMILIDAPPVGSVTDAAVLSTYIDGVILVIASGQTTIEAAKRARDVLQQVKANVLGVVLNKIKKNNTGSYYYYYYSSYEAYYGEEDTTAKKRRRKKKKKTPNHGVHI